MVSGEQVGVTRVGALRGATMLAPVRRRAPWIACGLLVQAAAVAMALAWAYRRYKNDAMTGVALRTTVKLVWTETVHSAAGVAVLAGSAVLFAAGSVLLARPYVRSVPMLLVVVPIAALAGLAVLGAFALVVAVLAALASAGFDGFDGSGVGGGSRKRAKARDH